MIQKIYKNTDLLFTISIGDNDNIINIADISELNITFYTDTTNVENHIVVTKDDIINNNQIFLDNTKLDLLNEGLLKYNIKLRFNNTNIDEPFDIAKTVETEYFIKNDNYNDGSCTGGTVSDTYSKSEIDLKLSLKANSSDVYSKAETNERLADKANKTDIPNISNLATKDELKLKANTNDVYSKSEVDAKFDDIEETDLTNYYTKIEVDKKIADAGEVDLSSYYKKAEVDSKLAEKADISAMATMATKAELSTKADISAIADMATKTELAGKADAADVYTKSQTYSKSEVNDLIDNIETSGTTVDLTNYYKKNEVNALLANKADTSAMATMATKTELAGKANLSDVYSKNQTYNKAEIDEKIANAGTTGGTGTVSADVLHWDNTIASTERAELYDKLYNNIFYHITSFVFLDVLEGNKQYMIDISDCMIEGSKNEIKMYGSTISSASTTVSIFSIEVILKKDGSFTINKKTSELYNKAEIDRLLSMKQDLSAIEARIETLESEITNPTNITVDCLNYE
jgi:hypothetical protein|nr:MAG TPA: hypothetical protein [Caudoviricetes sp.]